MPRLDNVQWGAADSVFADVATWDLDAFTIAGSDRTDRVRGSTRAISAPSACEPRRVACSIQVSSSKDPRR